MASLERVGWLGLALVPCSALLLLVGTVDGRASTGPRSTARAPERGYAEVRGRLVLAGWNEWTSGETALAPRRTAVGGRSRSWPCLVEVDAATGLAVLTGRITRDGHGVPARVRLELGWNRGIAIDTAADGSFRRAGLAPGFQLVTAEVEGRAPCRRTLFLPAAREGVLELDFGASHPVRVRVLDAEGRPVAGAAVELDGVQATTDPAGTAALAYECSGAPELVVRAPGFAWFTSNLERTAAELEIRLEPACSLELALQGLASPEEAAIYFLPLGPERLAGRPPRPATPWHLVSPLRAAPGTTVRLENLPAGEVEIRVLHPGARARPVRVRLDPRHAVALDLRLEEVPSPEREAHEALLELPGLLSSASLGSLPRLQPLLEVSGRASP